MKSPITSKMTQGQAYKFYLAPLLFFIHLIAYPYCYANSNIFISLLFAIFPGAYLFSWLCFLIHETWHKYVSTLPNQFLFNLYSWLLASDPQVYRIAHATHHTHTHTWEDLEFYPMGKIKNKYLRRAYNLMHFLVGQLFIYNVSFLILSKHPKFRWHKVLTSLIMIILLFGVIFFISHFILQVSTLNIFIGWLITMFVGGSIQHNSQLIEHWGIIAEDKPLSERNLLSRNLRCDGLLERFFLFLTHWDSHEHVLHHIYPGNYSRPFVNSIPLPENAVHINFKKYLRIAWHIITE